MVTAIPVPIAAPAASAPESPAEVLTAFCVPPQIQATISRLNSQNAAMVILPKIPRLALRKTAPQEGHAVALVLTLCWQVGHSMMVGLAMGAPMHGIRQAEWTCRIRLMND